MSPCDTACQRCFPFPTSSLFSKNDCIADVARVAGYFHESFDVRNSCEYTRPYFAWPNSFFAELVDKLLKDGTLTAEILRLPRKMCGKKPPDTV